MKTSFSKKFLACVLSVCMILTVCAGALSVSAAAAGTATIAQVEIASDATEAIVPVTLTSDEAIGGAELYITVPAVAKITKVDIATAGYDLTFASAETDLTATAGTPVTAKVDVTTEGVAKFVLLGNGDFTGVATTVEINLTFAGEFVAGTTYDVDFAAGTMVGTAGNEDAVALTTTKGAIVVAAPHVCEYTYTNNGDNHTKACAGCGSSVVEDHTYTDGACVCGATEVTEIVPVEDSSIVVRDVVVSITSTLDMRVRVRKSVIPSDCARAEIVVTPTIYDSSYNPTAGTVFTESFDIATASSNLAIYPKNFSLFALDLPMYVQVNCYDANDNLYKYSPVYTYYPIDALKAQYNASASTDSAKKLNTIVTDLLNMSAAAQTFFASNASAGSTLKTTVEAGNLVNKDWPQDYATDTEPTYNTTDNKTYGDGFDATNNELRISADLSGAPILSYSLRKAKTAYTDRSKLTMTVSYTTYYGKAAGGEVVSDTITGDEWEQYVSGNHLVYKFRDCAMYDGNKTITVVVNYDGAEVVRSEYSLETYIAANSTGDTALAKCLKAMGIFGASARAYFSTLGTVDPA